MRTGDSSGLHTQARQLTLSLTLTLTLTLDLHNRSHIGVVDAARRDVGAEEHDAGRGAELIGHVPAG